MRKWVLVLLLGLLVFPLGLVTAQDSGSNVLIMARAADATGLDPHTQTAFSSFRLLELIYEPLVDLDADLNIVPALAESWEFSDDGLTLTFHLRQGVKFHDGADFTSDDVNASFDRILDENDRRRGARELPEHRLDRHAGRLHRRLQPVGAGCAAAGRLATTNAAIVSADDRQAATSATMPIGTGPFMLESWPPDQTTVLKANPDWWGDEPERRWHRNPHHPRRNLDPGRAARRDASTSPCSTTRWSRRCCVDDPTCRLNRVAGLNYHVLQMRAVAKPARPSRSPSGDFLRDRPPGSPRHRLARRRQGHRPADHAGLSRCHPTTCSATAGRRQSQGADGSKQACPTASRSR